MRSHNAVYYSCCGWGQGRGARGGVIVSTVDRPTEHGPPILESDVHAPRQVWYRSNTVIFGSLLTSTICGSLLKHSRVETQPSLEVNYYMY